MTSVLFHFIAGSLGGLVVFLIFTRLSGARSYSLPLGMIFFGLACASLAHFLSPWATPAILAIYAAASAMELYRERKDRKARESRNLPQ